MSSNMSRVKKFFRNAFGGNKTSNTKYKNDVRWEAVLDEDERERNEEKSYGQVGSFPDDLSEGDLYITNISVGEGNFQVTRASVYVSGEDESFRKFKRNYEKVSDGIEKVNSNCRLLDMDMATLSFNESDSSVVEFHDDDSHALDIVPANCSTIVEPPVEEDAGTSSHRHEGSLRKMCYGPELTCDVKPVRETSVLSSFVEDIEQTLLKPMDDANHNGKDPTAGENKFESSNSLDIEKELNDLMGTLCVDLDRKRSAKDFDRERDFKVRGKPLDDSVKETNADGGGSKINLAFDGSADLGDCEVEYFSTDSLATNRSVEPAVAPAAANSYWIDQRKKSKSFGERYKLGKLMRRGRQRVSMIELRTKAMRSRGLDFSNSNDEDYLSLDNYPDSADAVGAQQRPDLSVAYDRSSLIEPRVSSNVSLASRPRTIIGNGGQVSDITGSAINPGSTSSQMLDLTYESLSSRDSRRISGSLNESIDWSWLEEAMNNMNPEEHQEEPFREGNSSLRVDAECQTQLDQSWRGEEEEERMRTRTPSPRVSSSAVGVSGERGIAESRNSNKDMPCKALVSDGGTSGGSSWLRQSMRRIRHFNLEDPTRIRSAPPDSLRLRTESDDVEVTVNLNLINNRLPGSDDIRCQGRRTRTRPSSAPARRSNGENGQVQQQQQQQQQQHQQQHQDAETASSYPTTDTLDNLGYESDSTDRHPSPRERRNRNDDEESEESEGRSPLGSWPHGLSSVFAGLGCTLGLFNISRFAVLSVHFGSNFIIQFLMLSLILGIPLLAFHAALGQTLGAGPVDMWKISPLFQGIGIALLLAQALIGMYSIVGVSWMFVYFRDSFITKQDTFRWAEPFRHYHRQDNIFASSILNVSGRLEETVPDYLNVVVLQRHGLTSPENAFGHLKFQLTFNLAVVWMIVFVSLSKGLRSYGKVVYVFSVVPVFGVLIICSKLLGLTSLHRGFFPQTEWSEFFLNAKSWISAATEVMLTWNLLGVATMQVTSHNRSSKKLWRDIATIILLTLLVLILAAFLGNLCHQLISLKGYSYVPSSFERVSTYSFLRSSGMRNSHHSYGIPTRHMSHASLVAGERVGKPDALHESGYQVLRFATELLPATLAILGENYLSPFWAVLFYFTLILFGIAQQLAIWHCVITGIMAINAPILKSWETTITFFACAAGFILGLPMTTELGIFVVYFLDYCLGGGWWVVLLTLMEICAILMVRGRPYSGENISIALFGKNSNCFSLWAIPLLTFTWNVIMPVALLVMSITIFKSGGYRDLWIWKCGKGDYWPLWTREVGVFVQIVPLLCIPIVGFVQCYRYLSKGPADIFDRLANLYRPATNIHGIGDEESNSAPSNIPTLDSGIGGTTELPVAEDPPPKYTPPPSYSTATGTRIAKLLRQSFRRSIRRIQTALGPEAPQPPRPPPPDYNSVLVEMNHNRSNLREANPPTVVPSSGTNTLTAADVAQILRCSFRRTNNNNSSSNNNNNNNTLLETRTNVNENSDPSPNLVISPRESD